MKQQGLYCVTCGRQTLHNSVGGVNHVLHFLIGFLTCGLWWFVWLLLVMNDSPTPRCAFCGTQYDHRRAVAAYAEASGIELPQAPALKPLTPEEKAARARETWRNLAILAGVIVLFAVGSVALVAFLSRQPAPSRPVGRPVPPADAATPTPAPSKAGQANLAARGPEPKYCPSMGFRHLGLLDAHPPCEVEIYLTRALHDPGSFSMDDLCQVGPGKAWWDVQCTFRARNRLGANVLQTWRFRMKGGVILSADQIR